MTPRSTKIERVIWKPEAFETKVLFRDSDYGRWRAGYFSHYNKCESSPFNVISKCEFFPFSVICADTPYKVCIPYEGNEHLLGTRDMPEKEYVIEGTEVDKAEENPSGTV